LGMVLGPDQVRIHEGEANPFLFGVLF
jgi:hypothetical protein